MTSAIAAACPYCRAGFEPDEEVTTCETCATPHHADCYAENGGCTLFGCANAPQDEPKISVSAADLNTRVASAPSTLPPGRTPPPPHLPGDRSSIAPPPIIAAPAPQVPLSFGGYIAPLPSAHPAWLPRRNRLTYILLGVFLGAFGGHNFYAGHVKRAVLQLSITVLTCFWGGIGIWIWALIEVCTITQDDDGIAFI